MSFIKRFKEHNEDLFEYQKSSEIHPHDQFMAATFLKLLPQWITPNRLSIFRILATPIVCFLMLFDYYEVGVVAFLLVAFTDVLDGSLARTKGMVTKFGMMIDPLADKLLIGTMVLILVFQYLNMYLGIAVLGLEIIFIASAYVARVKWKTVRMANLWGKIKMLLQVLAVCSILIALVFHNSAFLSVATAILGLSVGFAILSLFKHGL